MIQSSHSERNFTCTCCRYVLLHHVMGELEKAKGAWGYVEGGMGGVSKALANAARSYGADIFTEKVTFNDRKAFATHANVSRLHNYLQL